MVGGGAGLVVRSSAQVARESDDNHPKCDDPDEGLESIGKIYGQIFARGSFGRFVAVPVREGEGTVPSGLVAGVFALSQIC
jgi:hypothetical protein